MEKHQGNAKKWIEVGQRPSGRSRNSWMGQTDLSLEGLGMGWVAALRLVQSDRRGWRPRVKRKSLEMSRNFVVPEMVNFINTSLLLFLATNSSIFRHVQRSSRLVVHASVMPWWRASVL